ncbi:MAG: aminotransferase class I/II-fold pyridoxal phosphate-dependent enzyme [Actinomycetota bacterium]|nr:aminotransferase class I/II-fold pyridoxal phosphate-dependent enzyme [Actinomycetota bacterium]
MKTFLKFFQDSTYSRRVDVPGIADFVAGNPQEMAMPEYIEALQKAVIPKDKNWFAYKMSEPEAQKVVAERLRTQFGAPFEPRDVFMTNAAFAGIASVLKAVVDPGDDVIYFAPPHFTYESMVLSVGANPVKVSTEPPDWDLDIERIRGAITPKTRLVLVNTPQNPTGKIYPKATLIALAELLTEASRRNGRTIYLMSDEAYHRLIFDDREFPSPTLFYPASFLIYSYGKQLLAPGQRIGYIALPPGFPDRDAVEGALIASQFVTGYAFPNALLQHALVDLDHLSIDIKHLHSKRDLMIESLRSYGYEVHSPDATFYLMPKSPTPDDWEFSEWLAARDIFVLPGSMMDLPGYFRISLTASDEMIEKALPVFEEAFRFHSKVGSKDA